MPGRLIRGVVAMATGAAVLGLVPAAAVAAAAASSGTGSPPAAAVAAAGEFVASVDFTSLQARDLRGARCELTVRGTLTFSGTVEGSADGTTTAVVLAPCDRALATSPGTYVDVFRFEGAFTGRVRGVPAGGPLRYAGVTRAGGEIDATIRLSGDDARAVLRADARVAVGGTYRGIAQNH